MSVPFVDLPAQMAPLLQALGEKAREIIASGHYVMGPYVADFEQQIARYLGCAHALGVASGTDALLVALRALDVGPGVGVVTSPFTFFASAATIALLGGRPQLADVELDTALLEPGAAAGAVAFADGDLVSAGAAKAHGRDGPARHALGVGQRHVAVEEIRALGIIDAVVPHEIVEPFW